MRLRRMVVLGLASVALATWQPLPAFGATSIAGHPRTFLTRDGVDRIRVVVAAGAEPWKTAFGGLVTRARAALEMRARSVTSSGKSAGSHDYRTDPPYTYSDGVTNPRADRADYEAAMAVAAAVRDLGLAYAVTGETRYAAKALQLVRVWALDPATRMTPRFTNGQSQIELCITLPGLFYGADLIWTYPGWTADERAAFESWVRQLLASAKTWSAAQNFENWRHVFVATAAAFLDDVPSLDYAFARFRAVIDGQMSTSGKMIRETNRSRSLFYSTYAVNAMTQTAEIARLRGVNLYDYTTTSGKGLRKALDFHAPYVLAPTTWPDRQITAYHGENAAMYELAYAYWEKSTYMKVIDKWDRPMIEERILGPVTVTHADGLQSEDVAAPPPPKPPAPPATSLLPTARITATSRNFAADHPVQHLWDGCTEGTPQCTAGAYGIPSFTVDLDLGATRQLTEAALFGDATGTWTSASWTMRYRTSTSEPWKTAFAESAARGNQWYVRALTCSARYVRFEVQGSATGGTQARELRLMGR